MLFTIHADALTHAHSELLDLAGSADHGVSTNTRLLGRVATAQTGIDFHSGSAKAYRHAAQLLAEHFPSVLTAAAPGEQERLGAAVADAQERAPVRFEIADDFLADGREPRTPDLGDRVATEVAEHGEHARSDVDQSDDAGAVHDAHGNPSVDGGAQ